jgi:hypothetical protein
VYSEIWTYRANVLPNGRKLEGFTVEAQDGRIGKIDEATDEVGGSAVVVDTGPWIFGRKVIVPAGVIERVDWDENVVHVGLTKDQVKDSPEFDAERGWRDEEYRNRLGEYYNTTYGTRRAS